MRPECVEAEMGVERRLLGVERRLLDVKMLARFGQVSLGATRGAGAEAAVMNSTGLRS
jgi:hypothetical protein